MARNNPQNPAVARAVDSDPGNRSSMSIEPSPEVEPQITPQGRYNDRVRVRPFNNQGKANPQALKNWPEGQKKA